MGAGGQVKPIGIFRGFPGGSELKVDEWRRLPRAEAEDAHEQGGVGGDAHGHRALDNPCNPVAVFRDAEVGAGDEGERQENLRREQASSSTRIGSAASGGMARRRSNARSTESSRI